VKQLKGSKLVKPLVALRVLVCLVVASHAWAIDPIGFNGGRAFEDMKRIVAFGPRPSGSQALAETREWLQKQLRLTGVQFKVDSFVASTPAGQVPMANIIAKFSGARPQVVIVAGHYDTKRFDNFRFVGANDGGSSAAFVLEMARVLAHRKNALTYWLVFFDGEEAFHAQWSDEDNTYGSRHLVQKLTAAGELGRIKALLLVDMIGDANLDIHRDYYSTAWLTDLVFRTAHQLGYSKYFEDDQVAIADDHIPFVNAGVSSVDLIDLDYGPNSSYWHTASDTLAHCSPLSLSIVGRVVTATLSELEKSPYVK
jgi:glutaminyl-peptide cyclotransferase